MRWPSAFPLELNRRTNVKATEEETLHRTRSREPWTPTVAASYRSPSWRFSWPPTLSRYAPRSALRRRRVSNDSSRPSPLAPLAPRCSKCSTVFPWGQRSVSLSSRTSSFAAAVLSSASFAVLLWNGNWFAVTGSAVVGLALVGAVRLALDRMSADTNGNGGTGAVSPADALAADLNMAVDNEGEPLEEFEVRMIRGVVN